MLSRGHAGRIRRVRCALQPRDVTQRRVGSTHDIAGLASQQLVHECPLHWRRRRRRCSCGAAVGHRRVRIRFLVLRRRRRGAELCGQCGILAGDQLCWCRGCQLCEHRLLRRATAILRRQL